MTKQYKYATIIIKNIHPSGVLHQGARGHHPQTTSGGGACLRGGDFQQPPLSRHSGWGHIKPHPHSIPPGQDHGFGGDCAHREIEFVAMDQRDER